MEFDIYQGLTYLIGAIILILCKSIFDFVFNKIKKQDIKNVFTRSISYAADINQELSTIRDMYGFNRVTLIDNHNGTNSFDGLSFKNISMRYEVTDIHTKPIIKEFQNMPCSIIATLIRDLDKNKKGYTINSENDDNESSVTLRMYGIKKSYNFKLSKSLTAGIICMHINGEKEIDLNEDDIKDINARLQKINLLRLKK